MSQALSLQAAPSVEASPASTNNEKARSYWLAIIFWLTERSVLLLLMVPTAVAAIEGALTSWNWVYVVSAWFALPLLFIVGPLITLTKNIENDKHTVSQAEAKEVAFSRRDRWVGSKPRRNATVRTFEPMGDP